MSFLFKPLFSLASACLAVWLTAPAARAVTVSADSNGGYGAQVMDIILANWTRPAGASGSTSVTVRITNDGRPFSCELRKSSGNPTVDDAICLAVAKAGSFPPTPYAAPAEVALTFLYDGASGEGGNAEEGDPVRIYTDSLVANATPHLTVPKGLKGTHSVTVRLVVLPDGSLREYKVESSSGSADLDAAVLRALLEQGVITPPPDGQEQTVYLTFTVTGDQA